MQCSRRTGKRDTCAPQSQALGPGCHPQKGQGCKLRSSCYTRKAWPKTAKRVSGAVPEGIQRADRNQGRSGCRGARALLIKKKDKLGLKGPLRGHFKPEIRKAVVEITKETISRGISQKRACEIFGISPRKFRRWANPKPIKPHTAWNKLLEHERQAIEEAAWLPQLLGKPISHIYVYGHESDRFYASLSTVYRVLKAKDLVKPIAYRRRTTVYVSAHALLDEGFSLLCYDGTQLRTDTGIIVWAIPVIILPQRYLLHIGHAVGSISSGDLTRAVQEAHALIPEQLTLKLLAHSDRGSAMKSRFTKDIVKELLGAPVHFGRPHTPDDEGWIESFIKTLKYHREVPQSFALVDDILRWLDRFPDIYNNDPHSSLSYVTPLQALLGQKEVILNQRKQNLALARLLRYTAWQTNRHSSAQPLEASMQPA